MSQREKKQAGGIEFSPVDITTREL
jgi:hypothetical protein